MKFSVAPKDFKAALDLIVSASDQKDSGISSYLLIESLGKKAIQLSAAGLDISARRTFKASVSEEGGLCVSAKKFISIIKNLDEETTVKTETNDWLRITSGKYKARLPALNKDKFPAFPSTSSYPIKVDSVDFSSMIKSTAFAVTKEENRYALHGVKLEFKNGTGRMIATDGTRIVYNEKPVKGTLDTLLPKRSLDYLTKLPKGILSIGEDTNHLFFQLEDLLVVARKVVGTFPDYKQVTEFKTDKEISFALEDLKKTIKRVTEASDSKVNAVTFELSKDSLKVSTVSAEMGEAEDEIEADYQGKEVKIALNSEYLKDFLAATDSTNLYLNFKDANSPLNFNFGDSSYSLMLMPMRIN